MANNETVSTFEVAYGHTITKTLVELSGAHTTHPYKFSAWETYIKCSCGWNSNHPSKLSNKVITEVHNHLFLEEE